jgi:hypothetical protein
MSSKTVFGLAHGSLAPAFTRYRASAWPGAGGATDTIVVTTGSVCAAATPNARIRGTTKQARGLRHAGRLEDGEARKRRAKTRLSDMTGMLLNSNSRGSKSVNCGGSPSIGLSIEQRVDTVLCSSISFCTRDAKA